MFFDIIVSQTEVTTMWENTAFNVTRMRTINLQVRWKLLSSEENVTTDAVVTCIMRNLLCGPRAGEEKEESVASHQDKMEALHADVSLLPFLDKDEAHFAANTKHGYGLMKRYILEKANGRVLQEAWCGHVAEDFGQRKGQGDQTG